MYLIIIIIFLLGIGKFYYKFANGRCSCKNRMDSQVVIVTGSNTGIGFETAKELAKRGARVILACRNEIKGAASRDAIIQSTGNSNVICKYVDFTSFASVRAFANDILKTESRLDVLINNAGTGNDGNFYTKNNITIETQVNHFSPFLLTMTLLPLLKASAPSRIINVSSIMHKVGTVDVRKFHKQTNYLESLRVYSNTKLANILFTRKLSKVLQGTGVTVNCLHPGAVNTMIWRNQPRIVRVFIKLFFNTAIEGAQTSIHLAVSKDMEGVTGKYFVDCRETKTALHAEDDEAAAALWRLSKDIVSIEYNDKDKYDPI